MKFDVGICKGISCPECSFNKGEDGCLLAERLDEIEIIPEPCEDAVSRKLMYELGATCMARRDENGELVALGSLDALPSAQPDGISLEWIDKHLEWLDNCDNDFAQLAKVGIRAMVDLWKKDRT